MLEYCFAQAAEHADQPLHVWSQLLRKEVQVRRRKGNVACNMQQVLKTQLLHPHGSLSWFCNHVDT